MKKLNAIVSLGILCLLNQNIIAQKGSIKGAIVGGTNIAFPVGADVKQAKLNMKKSEDDAVKNKGTYSGSITPKIGMHLGGTVSYFITDQFAVNSGLIFSQRGYRDKSEKEIPKTGTYYAGYNFTTNSYYTEFSYKEKEG